MIDLQHIPNRKDAKRLIVGYSPETGIAIGIPSEEHFLIKRRDNSLISNARTLLAVEIFCLRKYTSIPNSTVSKIISANKSRFPNAFKK